MKQLMVLQITVAVCLGRPQTDLSDRIVFGSDNGEDLSDDCRLGEVSFGGACYWRGERGPCNEGQVIWVTEDVPAPTCIPNGMLLQEVIKPTEVLTESTEVRTEAIELLTKSSEAIMKQTEEMKKIIEVLTKPTETLTKPTELLKKITEVSANPFEVQAKTTEVPTTPSEVQTKPTEVPTNQSGVLITSGEGRIKHTEAMSKQRVVVTNPTDSVQVLLISEGSGLEPLIEEPQTEEDFLCQQQSKVLWKGDGMCYSLLTQGPCPPTHWLQLVRSSPKVEVECVVRPCQEENQVWWPQLCQCVSSTADSSSEYGARQICGKGGELLWSPYGEGVCGCAQDPPHEAGEDGVCYELGKRGPCEDRFIWKSEDGGAAECVDENAFRPRIFDLIPFNSGRKASIRNCHVDSRGRCRRRLRFNRRGRRQAGINSSQFLEWLRSFDRRSKGKECIIPQCENDTLPWVDGNCYQMTRQGPCGEGSWLVLQSVLGDRAVMKCQVRRCGEGEVWGSETCGCVAREDRGVCGDGSEVAVAPTGEGVCVREMGERSCHVDQHGKCHRTLKLSLGQRREFEEPSIQLQKEDFSIFLVWLDKFSNETKPFCL